MGLPRAVGKQLPLSKVPGRTPHPQHHTRTARTAPGAPAVSPPPSQRLQTPRWGGLGDAAWAARPAGCGGRGLLPLRGAEGTRARREAIPPPLRSTNGSSYRRAGTLPNPRGPPLPSPGRLDPPGPPLRPSTSPLPASKMAPNIRATSASPLPTWRAERLHCCPLPPVGTGGGGAPRGRHRPPGRQKRGGRRP